MQGFHYGVIAVALLAGASLAIAQENKAQQNSADEALVKNAPESKDTPKAPAGTTPMTPQAVQPGLDAQDPILVEGTLAVPGAPQDTQDKPAKYSAKNDRIDKTPIMAYFALTDEQKRAIRQRVAQGQAPASNVTAKPAEQVPATLALQELPPDLAAAMPSLNTYKYLRLNDRILVVNPRESIVVGEIAN